MIKTPHGYQQVLDTFGDPSDDDFQGHNIVSQVMPFQMKYRDDANGQWSPVTHVRIHKLIASPTVSALTSIWNYARSQVKKTVGYDKTSGQYDDLTHAWLTSYHLDEYGGAYEDRSIRGSTHLSMHAFGIALDFAPEQYPLGSEKRLPDWYSAIWQENGFFCGQDFSGRKDPMHVQFAIGC